MRKPSTARREMLKLMGASAAGAVLAACMPSMLAPEPTTVPTHEDEVSLPTGAGLEGFEPRMAPPDEEIHILYWWGSDYEPVVEFTGEIIARFSEAYLNVIVEPVGGKNCDDFVTAVAAGTPPDLFHTWDCAERMGNWAKRGMILSLDDYIEGTDFPLDDYAEGIMDACRLGGKIWGMVDAAGVFLLWTRPQILADIGKGVDALPKDTDELWQWARELTTTDADGSIERLGMVLPNWRWQYLSWIANFGGVTWDVEQGKPTSDHPGILEALNDLKAQVEYWGVERLDVWSANIGSQVGAHDPWLADNLAMKGAGDWAGLAVFDFFPDWEFGTDYGVIAPPAPPAHKVHGESAVAWWVWPWVIPSGIDSPEWSWEVLRFFLSAEYQVNAHAKFKEILVRKSLINDERLWWPAARVAKELIEGDRKASTVMPMNPVAYEYLNLMDEAVYRVLHLTETPEEAMARVKAEVLAVLAKASD